jgi:phosphoribosylaminoimidazole-succinocarboxamide synthase
MSILPLLHKGSVKDIYGNLNQSPYVFKFSDRYSVFDWGEMPDSLDGKGMALASMAKLFFQVLGDKKNWANWETPCPLTVEQELILNTFKENGMKHHGIGLVDDQNINLTDGNFSNSLAVEAMNVISPSYISEKRKYDYKEYTPDLVDTLVPLEVIFRFDISNGSSLLKRTGDSKYLKSMGLEKAPTAGDHYDLPLIEFSTKLESTDRYLPLQDAREISNMNIEEINRLKDVTVLLALRLKDVFKAIGVALHDGKFEFAFAQNLTKSRTFQLIDSIGPDELRISASGKQLSKERLREFYRDGEWHKLIEKAKELAIERGDPDWKTICHKEFDANPPSIDKDKIEAVTMMYKTLTNELSKKYLNDTVFKDTWSMAKLIDELP